MFLGQMLHHQKCVCCCCLPMPSVVPNTQLNMAGKEEDSSSAENAGTPSANSTTSETDRTSRFDFRPSFEGGGSPLPAHLGPIKQLHSATGYNLAVDPNGRVYGTREPYSEEAVLEITSSAPGEVQIKGKAAQLYVAMNERGKVYAEADPNSENTIFIEKYHEGWNCYLSKFHLEKQWYLGIKKSGKPKKGEKTRHGQKAGKFLPRPAYRKN